MLVRGLVVLAFWDLPGHLGLFLVRYMNWIELSLIIRRHLDKVGTEGTSQIAL